MPGGTPLELASPACARCGRKYHVRAERWQNACRRCGCALQPLPLHPRRPRPLPFSLAGAGLFTALLLACVAVAPGMDDLVLWPSVLYFLASPVIGPALVVWARFRAASWRSALLIGLAALFPSAALFCYPRLSWWGRERALAELALRSVPIIEAVHTFERAHGVPPATLDALVPEYLGSIPSTGTWAFDDFGYWARNGDWGFQLDCPRGILNWDEFCWPPEDSPDPQPQIIEGWGYYHE